LAIYSTPVYYREINDTVIVGGGMSGFFSAKKIIEKVVRLYQLTN